MDPRRRDARRSAEVDARVAAEAGERPLLAGPQRLRRRRQRDDGAGELGGGGGLRSRGVEEAPGGAGSLRAHGRERRGRDATELLVGEQRGDPVGALGMALGDHAGERELELTRALRRGAQQAFDPGGVEQRGVGKQAVPLVLLEPGDAGDQGGGVGLLDPVGEGGGVRGEPSAELAHLVGVDGRERVSEVGALRLDGGELQGPGVEALRGGELAAGAGGAERLSREGVEGLLQGIGRDHGGQQVDERVGVQLRGEANELLPGDGPRVSHVEAGGHGAHRGGVGVRRGPGAQGGEVVGGVGHRWVSGLDQRGGEGQAIRASSTSAGAPPPHRLKKRRIRWSSSVWLSTAEGMLSSAASFRSTSRSRSASARLNVSAMAGFSESIRCSAA